jgi:peptide/nickel transport system permease protein
VGSYVLRRLGSGVVVLIIVSMLAFLGLKLAPGDELTARMSPEALAQLTPQQIQQDRHALGLDAPLPIQYWKWLDSTLHGNLGWSSADNVGVWTDIRLHLGPSLWLMSTALVLGIVLALPLGIVAAVRQRTLVDYVVSSLPVALIGIPGFVLSLAAIFFFSVYSHLFPTSSMHTLGDDSFVDLVRHLVLPASILSIGFAVPLLRYTRASMLDALNAEHMVAARAKGLPTRTIILRHAFRNALLPIITVVGLAVPDVIAGAVITEQIFGWPGMGQLAVNAAGNRDTSLMLGIVLVIAIGVVTANLAADLSYAWADPRVRLGT